MQQTCNDEFWGFVGKTLKADSNPPCGKTYDDLTHSTQCPHDPLPPKLSLDELQTLADSLPGTKTRVRLGSKEESLRNEQKRT